MGQLSLDLNRYRTPSRFWERVESNPFVQALIVLCLAAVVAARLR